MSTASDAITGTPPVLVTIGPVSLEGNLAIPEGSQGIVLFAHGSGSSRHSPRNQYVARVPGTAGIATLLIDLLTEEEEAIELETRHLRFDVNLLATRLVGATDWLEQNPETRGLRIGYFGPSTGAGCDVAHRRNLCVVVWWVRSEVCPLARPSTHAPHRRRERSTGDRLEPRGPETIAHIRKETRDHSGGEGSL